MLKSYLKDRLKEKEILLMTHIVLGYPSLEDSLKIIQIMVDSGVDLIEMQIPFSEPIADGPVILNANQQAIASGITVRQCLDFSRKVTRLYNIPFLFMTYYNILYKYGVEHFTREMAACGLQGAIVPDLPPEEADQYIHCMKQDQLAPIYIFSPNTPTERMRYISNYADGFIYCVARKGVTGKETAFSGTLEQYLHRCRSATSLPLALGFGVKDKTDIDFLKGKADIAVIGSQVLRIIDRDGIEAVGQFIRGILDVKQLHQSYRTAPT
ncbi:MAG: tryptophan synthase subunit alpha [Deltaproteobacteria bacterium]|nr:tryptophan synthase subunit alpha [Deltaproteobacteria bacterium]